MNRRVPVNAGVVQKGKIMNNKVEELLSQLTLAEKVSLLAGADMWHTVPVERLAIPTLKVTDGRAAGPSPG
jgi:hypothetical protein